MTHPPIVPAPPPASAAAGPPTVGAAAVRAAAKTPIVGRPQRPVRPGLLAAGGGGALAASTAGGALLGGPVGAVALPLAVAGVGAGAVAVHRRLQRDPAKQAARAARPGLRARVAARSDAARQRRAAFGQRIRGALGRRPKTPAGHGAGPPRPTSSGTGPAPRRRGLPGRKAPGALPRSPGAPSSSPNGGLSPGGSRPGRSAGAGLRRLMPGAGGRAARAAHRARPAGGSTGVPAGGPAGAGGGRRFGLPGRNRPGSVAAGRGRGPGAEAGRGRSRLGRAWSRRPGGAGRAARGGTPGAARPAAGGSSPKPTPSRAGSGVRAMMSRARHPVAARRTPSKPAATGRKAGPPTVGAAALRGAPAKTRQVWSTRRKDRRSQARTAVAKAPRTGLRARVAAAYAKHTRTGSTKHVPWQDPPPPKGGGVGPAPAGGPKPAGPTPADAKEEPAAALGDDALWAWVGRREEKARREQATASPAGPLKPTGTRLSAARNRREQEATPPQTDASWAAGFRPGPEPPTDHARTAARDRWQRRNNPGGTMSQDNAKPDYVRWSENAVHRGDSEVQSMRDDMPAFAARHQSDVEDLASKARQRAAAIQDGTPSSQAVADAWLAHAAQLEAAAQTASELDAVSRSVDAAGYDAADRYAGRPGADTWMR